MPVPVVTVGLLLLSNVFMTFAWYGHLKFKAAPLVAVVVVSWLIAFFEYCAQVPANRIGHGHFSAAELNHPGGDHARRLRRLLGGLSRRADPVEPPRRLRADRRRGVVRLPEVVMDGNAARRPRGGRKATAAPRGSRREAPL
jgi:Putative member of DMT superfamily (DUF486)